MTLRLGLRNVRAAGAEGSLQVLADASYVPCFLTNGYESRNDRLWQ